MSSPKPLSSAENTLKRKHVDVVVISDDDDTDDEEEQQPTKFQKVQEEFTYQEAQGNNPDAEYDSEETTDDEHVSGTDDEESGGSDDSEVDYESWPENYEKEMKRRQEVEKASYVTPPSSNSDSESDSDDE
jgi:hypothetical protein